MDPDDVEEKRIEREAARKAGERRPEDVINDLIEAQRGNGNLARVLVIKVDDDPEEKVLLLKNVPLRLASTVVDKSTVVSTICPMGKLLTKMNPGDVTIDAGIKLQFVRIWKDEE